MVWKSMFRRTALASVLAGGFLLLGTATVAHADDYYSCRRNVEKWDSRLRNDVHRHGDESRQANHDRHELAEARERCERRYGDNWRDRDRDRDDHRDYDRNGYQRDYNGR
jgi:hypothetical protein